MAHNEHLLHTLCRYLETRNAASTILREAHVKTAPGTGYTLGPRTTALPAICALIASMRLNNSDVVLKDAQVASCLKPSEFNKALATVQAALEGSSRHPAPPVRARALSYEELREKYSPGIPPAALSYFPQAASALALANPRFKPEASEIRCAVFHWLCSALETTEHLPSVADFARDTSVSPRVCQTAINELERRCGSVRDEMCKHAYDPPVASALPIKRSPTKSRTRELPSKDSPKKRPIEHTFTVPDKQSAVQYDIPDAPPTPLKKRKLDTDVPLSVNTMENEDENSSNGPPSRFRPVFLDSLQWYAPDPRLARLWTLGEKVRKDLLKNGVDLV